MRTDFLSGAARYFLALALTFGSHVVLASDAVDPLIALPTAQAVLAALSPPTSVEKLENGNDLLLESPDIVRSGPFKVRLMSAMPRTDAMWLLSLLPPATPIPSLPYVPSGKKTALESNLVKPQAVSPPGALLASFHFKPDELPEKFAEINLDTTQTLLLVVRAGGRYFGVRREVKVGYAQGSRKEKK